MRRLFFMRLICWPSMAALVSFSHGHGTGTRLAVRDCGHVRRRLGRTRLLGSN
jgi:hypothetical protein